MCKLAALGFGFERAFGFDDDGDYYSGDPNPARARWVDVDVEGRVVAGLGTNVRVSVELDVAFRYVLELLL